MVCTGRGSFWSYIILEWFNIQSLYCILIYENQLDFGDITESRSGMHFKKNYVHRQGHKCRKLLTLLVRTKD